MDSPWGHKEPDTTEWLSLSLLFSLVCHSFSSNRVLISWLQSLCGDFGAQQNKICHYFHFPPSAYHEMMGLDAMIKINVFRMLSLKPAFHSPLSTSSRGSLVPLHFLSLPWPKFNSQLGT